MHRSPAPGYGSTRTFSQKLGLYMLGIGIGLLLFGWFQMRKRQAAAHQRQQAAQVESSTPAAPEPDEVPADTPAQAPAPDGG